MFFIYNYVCSHTFTKNLLSMKQSYLVFSLCTYLACASASAQHSLHFDGIDDYTDLGAVVGTGIRTVELWFKPDSTIDSSTFSDYSTLIVRNSDNCGGCQEYGLQFVAAQYPHPGTIRFYHYDDNANLFQVFSDGDQWQAGEWHHVAGVLDPDMGMLLFIDGHLQSDIDTGGTEATHVSTFITALARHGNIAFRYFKGNLDDVRLSTVARYQADFVPPCPDLVTDSDTRALWNLNETTGTTANDASGNGFDGTVYGAAWLDPFTCDTTHDTTGIAETANRGETWNIYPNPSTGQLIYEIATLNGQEQLTFFTLTGAVVKQVAVTQSKTVVDISNLAPGVYLLKIATSAGEFSRIITRL